MGRRVGGAGDGGNREGTDVFYGFFYWLLMTSRAS